MAIHPRRVLRFRRKTRVRQAACSACSTARGLVQGSPRQQQKMATRLRVHAAAQCVGAAAPCGERRLGRDAKQAFYRGRNKRHVVSPVVRLHRLEVHVVRAPQVAQQQLGRVRHAVVLQVCSRRRRRRRRRLCARWVRSVCQAIHFGRSRMREKSKAEARATRQSESLF